MTALPGEGAASVISTVPVSTVSVVRVVRVVMTSTKHRAWT